MEVKWEISSSFVYVEEGAMNLHPVPRIPMCIALTYITTYSNNARTFPIGCGCQCDSNDEIKSFVIKLINNNENKERSAVRELIGNVLAYILHLPVPGAAKITISKNFPKFCSSEHQSEIKKSIGLNFGCLTQSGDYRQVPPNPRIRPENIQSAIGIFAFDLFTQNLDRTKRNSNLLEKAKYVMIDHEYIFSNLYTDLLIGEVAPMVCWELDKKSKLIIEHVFYNSLRQANDLSVAIMDFCKLFSLITQDIVDRIFSQVPKEWRTEKSIEDMQKMHEQILLHANNPDKFTRFLQEVLG
ncbi:MAG: hypothetical protein JXA25_19375 [Anaerolineales bacterium]|nr:hypothetical protein [Anaerolineales bacterium]